MLSLCELRSPLATFVAAAGAAFGKQLCCWFLLCFRSENVAMTLDFSVSLFLYFVDVFGGSHVVNNFQVLCGGS